MTTPTNPTEAASLADRLELAAQGINDAFVVSRWTDAQRVADTLRAAAADLRSIPQARGMNSLAKLEHKWRMNAGDYTIDCAWRQMYGEVADELEAALRAAPSADVQAPIPMVMFCPMCGTQHVDAPDERTPEWDNPPHRSHLCHACGCIWRPADVATVGVRKIETRGKADTFDADAVREYLRATPPQPAGAVDDAAIGRALSSPYGNGEVSDMLRGGGDEEAPIMRAALEAARIGVVAVSDHCAISGCVHAEHGCPTWPAGTNPFAAAPSPTPGVTEPSWHHAADALREYARDITEGCVDPRGRFSPASLKEWAEELDAQEGHAITATPPMEASGREAEIVGLLRTWAQQERESCQNCLMIQCADEAEAHSMDASLLERAASMIERLATPSDEPKGNGNG